MNKTIDTETLLLKVESHEHRIGIMENLLRDAKQVLTLEEAAGENTAILVPAITGTGKFAVKTPDVDIKVNPDRLDLVETKFIGGRRCLVIAVEDNVEVNGMPVKMWEEQKETQ